MKVNFNTKFDSDHFASNGVEGVSLRGGSIRVSHAYNFAFCEGVPVALDGDALGHINYTDKVYGCVGEALLKVRVKLRMSKASDMIYALLDDLDAERAPQLVIEGNLVMTTCKKDPTKGFHGKEVLLVDLAPESEMRLVYPGDPDWVKPELEGKALVYTIGSGRTTRNGGPVVHFTTETEKAEEQEKEIDLDSLLI